MDACDRPVPSVEDIIPSLEEDVMSLSATTNPYGFELLDRQEASLSEAELERIRSWLQPTPYLADHGEFNRHLASHAPGTGVWLSQTDAYRTWHDSANCGSLWIKGVPGAGKSVIAAAMVDHFLKTEPNVPVLFFFFRQIVHANRRRKSMLCDWLAQLLPHSVGLQGTLMPLLQTPQEELPDRVLWECLLKALPSMARVYCIVDALDESEGATDDRFFHRLNELATMRPACVKLLMTSRPRQDLQSFLRAESIVHISLEETRVCKDIHSFVLHRLAQDTPELGRFQRSNLAKEIQQRSAGLFLYARLLVDQLIPKLQHGHSVNVEKLPVFILGCVTQCLRPLRLLELAALLSTYLQSDMTPAKAKILVKQACGPLLEIQDDETIQVIHHSFTEFLLDPQQRTSSRDGSSFPLVNPKLLHKRLAILCMDLLIQQWTPSYERRQRTATLNHFYAYAEQFWVQHLQYDPQTDDTMLFDTMNRLCDKQPGPFYEWASKIARPELGLSFSQQPCLGALHLAAHCGLIRFTHMLVHGGSVACLDGVVHYSNTGAKNVVRVPARIPGHSWSCLPLWWACRGGHAQMANELLPLTLPLPAMGNSNVYFDPDLIEVAASHGHVSVLQLLLKAGFGPLGFVSKDDGSLEKVTRNYTLDCLVVTLPYLDHDTLLHLLCLYAKKGNAGALKSLLTNTKIDIDKRFEGRTPLYYACWAHEVRPQHEGEDISHDILLNKGSIECVRLLLGAGASVTAVSDPPLKKESLYSHILELYVENNRTPLHGLVSAWTDDTHEICCEVFRLLIGAGADLESRDGMKQTPLVALFPDRHAQLHIRRGLEYLLEQGANSSVQDNNGLSVLHRALIYHREPSLIELLVGYGADVNVLASIQDHGQDRHNVSPLEFLFDDPRRYCLVKEKGKKRQHPSSPRASDFVLENKLIAKILVDNGANIDAAGLDRGLLKALPVCDAETLKTLLKSRKNSDTLGRVLFSLNRYKNSPKGRPLGEMIASLVGAGASLEEKDHRGFTPLLHSVDEPDLFEAFLAAGASRSAVDAEGNGVLQVLVSRCHLYFKEAVSVGKLRYFVNLGFNPRSLNSAGDSLLHLAITVPEPRLFKVGKSPSVLLPLLKQLIDYGISPKSTNAQGMTALHVFLENMTNETFPSQATSTSADSLGQILDILERNPDNIDINAQDAEGLAPIHIAAMSLSSNAAAALDVLIDHGADLMALTKDGRTVLHLACIARNTSVIPFLLDRAGPDLIHVKDSNGQTALFDAAMSGVLESVAALLEHGAEVNIQNDEAKTPLHACADFVIEQAKWELVEFVQSTGGNPASQPYRDRYRPFRADISDYPIEKQPWQKRRQRRGLFGGDLSGDNCFKSPFFENPNAAIYSVVNRLLEAGAENTYSERLKLDPVQYAWYNRCEGMMAALSEHTPNLGLDLVAQFALTKLYRPNWTDLNDRLKNEILQHPTRYISQLDMESMNWLVAMDANLFTTFSVHQQTYSAGLSSARTSALSALSFMHNLSLLGLTTFMERLREKARYFDSPSNKIDQWSVATAAELANEMHRKADSTWDLQKLAETFGLKIRPLVYQACARHCRNVEMIKVLVEKCGADVNAREIRSKYSSQDRKSLGALTAMAYMALTQEYWHLEAIKYLVSQGADVNVRDVQGQTPLIVACLPLGKKSRRWAPRFVKLLLELGADPNIQDDNGKTCIDLVTSQEILDLLLTGGVNMAARKANLLFTALDSFDVDLTRRALDEGVNLNESNNIYCWRSWVYPSQIKLSSKYPLVGAIVHSSKERRSWDDESDADKKRRREIVRLMLDRGADTTIILENGRSLLHAIVSENIYEEEIVDLLLEFSPTRAFTISDASGRSVFLAACDFKDYWNGKNRSMYDTLDLIPKLLEYDVDILAVDDNGMNALHIMLDNTHMPTARIISFLERPAVKALALAKDSWGRTAIDYALRILRPDVCSILLGRGSIPDAAVFEGAMSPLHFIAAQCFEESLRQCGPGGLFAYGNRHGASTMSDHFQAALHLWHHFIDAGIVVDTPDKNGDPPLFVYLRYIGPFSPHRVLNSTVTTPPKDADYEPQPQQIARFEALFANANLKVRNMRGDTALHVVASPPNRQHDVAIFKFLVDKGLDPLAEDHSGRSSLDVASEAGKDAILELFRKRN